MSYVRPLGDPITDPSQIDPTLPKPSGEIIVGEVPPTLVSCDQLPDNSPWKRPGQVCAPTLLDWLKRLFRPSSPSEPLSTPVLMPPQDAGSPSSDDGMSDGAKLALGAAAALGVYLYVKRKRKRT